MFSVDDQNTFDNYLRIAYDQQRFGNVGPLQCNDPPETVRSYGSTERMSEYRWFTDHGSVHQDRTSCRCLVRRSYTPWSPNKIQGVGADEYAASGSGEAEGHRHRSLRRCWGLRPFWPQRQQQLRLRQ